MISLVHEIIIQSARVQPSSPAIIYKKKQVSYQDLATNIQIVANYYHQLGIKQHDRIGIYLPKSIENVISIFASSMVGAIFIPVNPVLKAMQVQHQIDDCQIKLLITNKSRLNTLEKYLPELQSLTHIIITDTHNEHIDKIDNIEIIPWQTLLIKTQLRTNHVKVNVTTTSNDVAAIFYTSGSTGKPKGVILSHNNIIQGALSVSKYLNNNHKDRILAVLPLSFDYGFSQLTTSFLVGATCILLDYLLPNDVLTAIEKYKITGLAAVPPLWSQLCKLTWKEKSGDTIRYFTNSGGKLSTANLNTLRKLMPQAKPYLMYGLTEAFRSTFLPPEQLDFKNNSIGKAIPNTEILVLRKDGSECNVEESGELVHKGPLVSLGYWNNAKLTNERFRPAPNRPSEIPTQEVAVWSGDIVKKDKDGFLYFIARTDDMIKSSGYRISPDEITETLYQHNEIIDAVILGVPHKELGQAIVAVILVKNVGNDETMQQSILKFCRQTLPNYLVPQKIIILNELPLNSNGKIDRNQLKLTYNNLFKE